MTVVVNENVERVSALLCWPVEFLDYKERNIYQPHVTALYFPDVSRAEYSKDDLLSALRTSPHVPARRYELARVKSAEAFGPDKNVPVLRVTNGSYYDLDARTIKYREALDSRGIFADRTYDINPHVTVDLETLLRPPETVLLRPLELWWRNDEPVVV
jgi:hypothetical protein